MVKPAGMLNRLHPVKVVVIGDMLLDTYTIGKASRISPEAPVPVVNVYQENQLPGGAGNVIVNLISLGADVIPIGRVGPDPAGSALCEKLRDENVHTDAIFVQSDYRTPVKNRIIAGDQQIVRIDYETFIPLEESLEQAIVDRLPELFDGAEVIAVSDYGKGFLTDSLLSAIIKTAKSSGIPIITDPKGNEFERYRGSTIIKPNVSEAYSAARLPSYAALDSVASRILADTQAELLMITRSEAGIALFNRKGERQDFPVHSKEVKDVTGAGDTVLAMLAYAVANRLTHEEGAHLCNIAAGIAIEHVGCARITLSDLARRLLENADEDKIFDHEHIFVLKAILKGRSFNLLVLNRDVLFTGDLFTTIRRMYEEFEELVVYVEDILLQQPLVKVLSSLKEVKCIVTGAASLDELSREENCRSTLSVHDAMA